ncbi:SAM-dependent methyltransferase [Hymenobacter taeanensis]|uniref:SAM-dependent methyltransferase n=1 Tax=Hymenobacter taeanensis TaxID=2735321 RepID=A0A6M6BBG4_9BACT|nr:MULTISPECIES: SAM-dependent methyltransferase [Hymenobacter]QJX45711.1 SAM-dependent methyltransferase [Hymenobacter taeanensis]UOQ79549.1 TPMT family class I SAM-dependent methyltransferase [Hymenobacter sp. 5414T-23]
MQPGITLDAAYWQQRYATSQTAWDTGAVTPPLQDYFAQLGAPDARRVLIPGAGRAYEAEYLHHAGYPNIFVAEVAAAPLQDLLQRVPDFPPSHLLQQDFFQLPATPPYDMIVEQTFFCALDPSLRPAYARQCAHLLRPGGTLVGLLFDTTFSQPGPPFGGSREEYRAYFEPYFKFVHFETATNSIGPRQGRELFICLRKK